MKFTILPITILLQCVSVCAQDDLWSVQLNYIPGKLFKHSDKMLFEPHGLSQFLELNIQYHTQGYKEWERYYKKPRLGLGLRYLSFGKPFDVLGSGYSATPFIDFLLLHKNAASLRFKISCGLAYLEKTYHLKNNSANTAIGSHWNNLSSFQFMYEHPFNKSNKISAGICFSHISNGAFKAPNLGYNFVSVSLAYSFPLKSLDPKSTLDKLDQDPILESIPQSLFSFESHYGLSLKEAVIPGGPKFLIQWYFIDVGYQYNPYKSVRLAAELENNNIDSYFSSYSELKPNKKSAGKDDWSFNTYLAHQWLFGSISLAFRMGYEFNSTKTIEYSPFITKLDLGYIFPYTILSNIRPVLGFSLKAHLDTAAYIGLLAGFRYTKINRSKAELNTFTY